MRFRRGGTGRSTKVDVARVEQAFRVALGALLEDDADRAEQALAAVVQEDSTQIEVYLALGQLYRRRGEIGRAIRIHQNLLLRSDLAPEHRERALRGLARDFRKGGFLQRAISAFEELRDRRPRDPEALAALARLRADVRDFDAALDAHHRLVGATRQDGSAAEARLWFERSEALVAEGKGDAARRALGKCLRCDPGMGVAWFRLGELEAERGKHKKALSAWKKALAADRRAAARIYPRLESAWAALGRAREFETELRSELAQRPDDAEARLALARTLAARGQGEQALAELEALFEREPDRLAAHAARARILLGEGRDAEASKALAELLDVLERQGALVAREELA
jgi:lipopolysaccharide biosynthesis regulator YciM